jgi:hypothetical protein
LATGVPTSSNWLRYGADAPGAEAPGVAEPDEPDVDEPAKPEEPPGLDVPGVGVVEDRAELGAGLDGGAASGRKLVAPEALARGAGLGAGVTVGFAGTVGGLASSGFADVPTDGFDTEDGAGGGVAAKGADRPGALGRTERPPLAIARAAAASAASEAPDRAEPELEPLEDDADADVPGRVLEPADSDGAEEAFDEVDEPADEMELTDAAVARAAAADPEDDDPEDGELDDGELGAAAGPEEDAEAEPAEADPAAAEVGAGVGVEEAPGRAGRTRGGVSSLSVAASLASLDVTSVALIVIGDAPPPGICRDVLSGR